VSLHGNIKLLDLKYNEDILNQSLNLEKNIYTLEEISTEIYNKYRYRLINKIDELEMSQKFIELKDEKNIGQILDKILSDYDGAINVYKSYIKLEYPISTFLDLPYNWDMIKLKRELESNFKKIRFYIAGNRITANGLKKDLVDVDTFFNYLKNFAYENKLVKISIYPYCTNLKRDNFIGKRKFINSENQKPLMVKKIQVNHGYITEVNHNQNINMNLFFDIQNNDIKYKNFSYPINSLDKIGFVFKVQKNQNLIDDFFNILEDKNSCTHEIVVFDFANDELF
jgi:hypothetical protein